MLKESYKGGGGKTFEIIHLLGRTQRCQGDTRPKKIQHFIRHHIDKVDRDICIEIKHQRDNNRIASVEHTCHVLVADITAGARQREFDWQKIVKAMQY